MLDDADELAGGVANDSAVAGGIVDNAGGERCRGVRIGVTLEELAKGFGADEWAIASEDEDGLAGGGGLFGEKRLAAHDGVTGAELLGLLGELNTHAADAGGATEGGADEVLLVANDENDSAAPGDATGVNHGMNHGPTTDGVEDFGQVRGHPGAFAGSEDDRDGCWRSHRNAGAARRDRGRWARHRWNRSNGELTDLDSNQDKQYQKLLCYRYTIGQKDAIRRGRISPQWLRDKSFSGFSKDHD